MTESVGLDDVDWSSVHDAYGPATAVPACLRDLRSTDPDVRRAALRVLFGNIFHQGTRYRSSRHAVPFLVDLTADPGFGDRVKIIELIGHLAVGYPENWLVAGVDASQFLSGDVEFEAGRNEYHIDELDVYQAVCRDGDRLIALCRDVDNDVQRTAAYWLGFLPCLGTKSMKELTRLAHSATDSGLRANALISIALIAQSSGTAADLDLDPLLTSSDDLVRFAASIASVRLHVDDVSTAIAHLVDAIADPPTPVLAWNEGDLSAFAALTLAEAPGGLPDLAVDALCEGLEIASGPRAERLLAPLLRGLFRSGTAGVPQDPSDLDARQRRFLTTLAGSSTAWTVGNSTYANVALILRRFSLPSSRDQMRAYLAGHGNES